MNNSQLATAQIHALEQEIIQLRARIEKLRLGRRTLMNLLVLQEKQRQIQLQALEQSVSILIRHNAKLKQMLCFKEQRP